MRRLLLPCLLSASALGGCAQLEDLFRDPDAQQGYRLVGAYDAATLRGVELLAPEDDRPTPYEYLWRSPPRMQKACGPVKAPDGLGIFEAEAIGNRRLPTLALVVERMGDVPALDSKHIRVALGRDVPEFFLEPAVNPRYLMLSLEGDIAPRYRQQVRTQLQTYLCMEHKTGRAWQGGTGPQVRQALLLDPPDESRPDRKFFGGQSVPVASLLGPPEACYFAEPGADVAMARPRGGQGDSSLNLVPSDVWGASIERCDLNLLPGATYLGSTSMALALSDTTRGAMPVRQRTWSHVRIKVRPDGDRAVEQMVEVEHVGSEVIKPDDVAANSAVLIPEQPLFVETDAGEIGLIDIVSKLPYRYPTVGDQLDPDRYTVLLIPNWQLAEGVRRMAADDVGKPRPFSGDGVQDGVGWILEHPDNLFVMVPGDVHAYDPRASDVRLDWLNIAQPLSGGWMKLKDFGYATGMLTGRAPIALPGPIPPTWEQVAMAQRASQQSLFLGSVAILAVVFLTGISRMRDLWVTVPEERVEFWPGVVSEDGDDEEDDMADLSEGGGDGDDG